MNSISSGQGSAVVLLHGLFGNLDNLKNLAQSLEDEYQVIRVDLPNHGNSAHWPQMDYQALSQAIVDLLDEYQIDKAHLVGHSMGGKVAMAAAQNFPARVLSLVAADIAPVAYEVRHQKVFDALEAVPLSQLTSRQQAMTSLSESGIDAATAMFLLKNLQKEEQGFSWKMNLAGLKACYPKLIGWPNSHKVYNGPTLMLRGGGSDYVTFDHADTIMKQFPNVEAKTINGTGHWLHAQKPAVFNRIIGDFLHKHQG